MDISFEGTPALGRASTYSSIMIANRRIGYLGQDCAGTAYVVIYEADNSDHPAVVKLFGGKDPKSVARRWLTNMFATCRLNHTDAVQLSPIALFNEAARQAHAFDA
jgi:hypothetical protein